MLEFLGENESADRIKEVCADPAVQVEGTSSIGDAIAQRLV